MAQPEEGRVIGFFYFTKKAARKTAQQSVEGYSLDLIHKQECAVCPLRRQHAVLCHPNMQPSGNKAPMIYMLGEAPGKREDELGEPFVGRSGQLLRPLIPSDWESSLRWNNCVRTRPPGNRDPTNLELEACRPSVERDIIETEPLAIFGFGNVPLRWALKQTGITLWHGRRIPIRIGDVNCWFFPMLHPAYVLRKQRESKFGKADEELAFAKNLEAAFAFMDRTELRNDPPIVLSQQGALVNVETVTDVNQVLRLLKWASKQGYVGLDYETKGLRPYQHGSRLLTVAIATRDLAFAFPLEHSQNPWSEQDRMRVWDAFERFLYESPARKIVHHLAFELEWSAKLFGRKVVHHGNWEDTESQAYILDERRGGLSLNFLYLQYYGLELKSVTGNLNTEHLDEMPLETVLRYNALDAKAHRQLYFKQLRRLQDEELLPIYNHQLRRVKALVLSQLQGVPVDLAQNEVLHKRYVKRRERVEEQLKEHPAVQKFEKLTGHDYRPAAWQDVSLMCRKILKIAVAKTDKETISQIKHPIPRLTLKWRQVNKSLSTYVTPFSADSEHLFADGRLHPILSSTATRTWRTSSEDPNIQNVPKHERVTFKNGEERKSTDAREIRKQIAAPPGYKIVSLDYAGIQARNVAMESRDAHLVKAFNDGYDIHSEWRDRILKIFPQWVPGGPAALKGDKDLAKHYRQRAKNAFVFAAFFGAQPAKLAAGLGVPESAAAKALEQFWGQMPGVKKWHESLRKMYHRYGYITGLSGFRRRAPVKPTEWINTPIQSDESVIVLDALIRLSETGDRRLQPMLEVHDDLTFLWPKAEVDRLAERVIGIMVDCPFEWANIVPIEVEMSVGDNWGEMQAVPEVFSSRTWKGSMSKAKGKP